MGRIEKAYAARFHELLRALGARRRDEAIQWFLARARRLGSPADAARALSESAERLEQLVRKRARLRDRVPGGAPAHQLDQDADGLAPCFLCDAGLGGLARWLRAAGYAADWQTGIADDELLRRAGVSGAIVLTTDSLLLERRVVRDGELVVFWLPPALAIREQLGLVLRHFGLAPREPRCMCCGGELRSVTKEEVWERIPPRTRRWLDAYFECVRCTHLYWHGTHWQRIQACLRQLPRSAEPAG